ncbi:MAG: SDR family NAD(P)-dependent oxidoreductase [Gemmataceae bacterium]|nr:SDR family NAD(P)-dependent oxidoreductase [Gemmataceae bacterium]
MNSFTQRVALITGAGSGIGRQLARTLAAEGAAIAAVDLTPEPLAALAAELAGKSIATAVADVTERDALLRATGDLQAKLGPADLLIASAGIGIETSALQFVAADFERVVRVNLIGVANSVAAVLPGMIERKRGHLVGLSSVASYRGFPLMAGYCASKSGVNALFDSLRVELNPLGIHVTTICPSWIRTPMTEKIGVPPAQMVPVETAARHIVDAIRRRRAFYAFPPSDVRQVRLLGWLPLSWSDWLVRRMLASQMKK